jgi:cell division protein FtsQ
MMNHRLGKPRRRLLLLAGGILTCAAACGLTLTLPTLSRFAVAARDALLDHDYFSVREIKVQGGDKIGGSGIVAMAGLSHGMNLWKIDPRDIENKIARHPWVKKVILRREFPHRIVIEVEERVPKAVLVLEKMHYVDPDGMIFKEIEPVDKTDYPFITGLKSAELVSQPQSFRQKLREAVGLSDLMAEELFPVSEIHFSAGGGVVLYPISHPVALDMGWGDWPEKIMRLRRVWNEWKGKERHLLTLNAGFKHQVIVQLRKN